MYVVLHGYVYVGLFTFEFASFVRKLEVELEEIIKMYDTIKNNRTKLNFFNINSPIQF